MRAADRGFGSLVFGSACRLAAILLCMAPAVLDAAEWRIAPVRLDLGKDAKTGAITIINDKPDRLMLQVKAMEWAQDPEGKDLYTDTNELIFFPRIIVFDKDGERVIRVGIKAHAPKTERSYRLFLEEIPEEKPADGSAVRFALRVGVPVFVKPPKAEIRGEVAAVSVSGGLARAVVRNTGNEHLLIRSVLVKGKNTRGEEVFSKELSGWYLLAGAARTYETAIPPQVCVDLAVLEVDVKADGVALGGKVNADKAMCAP